MPLTFHPSPRMTLGVELELQILDARSRDLSPGAWRIFESLGPDRPHIKPEIFQSMIEINTGICEDVGQVRSDIDAAIAEVREACGGLGLAIAAAGSHPFARYGDRSLYPTERFQSLIDRNQWIARRLMVFGLHVHVGMRDGDHAVAMLNGMLPYLPHLLGASASSPFWQGDDTGLASSRITIFEALPTAGHPCTFGSWAEFMSLYDSMLASRTIGSIKDIWWDIRLHPDFGTVEVRICDIPPTVSEILSLVALTQTLFRWLDGQHREGRRFTPPPDWILRENKWRASRWGLEAEIVLDAEGRTTSLRRDLERLVTTLEPVAAELRCGAELRGLGKAIERGTSSDRQRRVFQRTHSLELVTEALVEEFQTDRRVES